MIDELRLVINELRNDNIANKKTCEETLTLVFELVIGSRKSSLVSSSSSSGNSSSSNIDYIYIVI